VLKVWLLVIGGFVVLFGGLASFGSARAETATIDGKPLCRPCFVSGTHWDPGFWLYLGMGLGLVALAVYLFVLAVRVQPRPETFRG
jgi:hypothetical protein